MPLSTGGFANVAVTEDKTGGRGLVVAQGTTLAVQPGGSITFKVANGEALILGSLIAPAGDITVSSSSFLNSTTNDIVVGPDAVISVAGQWINDDSLYANTAGAATYVNGGQHHLVDDRCRQSERRRCHRFDPAGRGQSARRFRRRRPSADRRAVGG